MISVYVKLFKVILKPGHIPKDWAMDIILPIYENKDPVTDPSNHWGITLLSCFCKLFRYVLHNRLTEYIDELGIMGRNKPDSSMIIPQWIVYLSLYQNITGRKR